MRLYRKDGSDINWITPNRSMQLISAMYLTPILMGIICNVLVIGLTLFIIYLPMMPVILITLDLCHYRYLKEVESEKTT